MDAGADLGSSGAGRVRHTLYRIVLTNPPTLIDFTSYAAQGRVLRRPTPELLRRWSGISVYDTEEQARHWARLRSYLGAFIAELVLDDGIRREQTGRPGHYTVWGEPALVLGCVVRVIRV